MKSWEGAGIICVCVNCDMSSIICLWTICCLSCL